MHARKTTTKGSPDQLGKAKQVIESQLIPAAGNLPGFKGAYWLADPETGTGLAFTFYDTKASLEASAQAATKLRGDTTQQIGADVVSVEEYEVVADTGQKVHKDASHVRVAQFEFGPAKIEDGISMLRQFVLPNAQKLPGFVGGFWLADRASGKGVGVTLFDSKENVVATREQANKIRTEGASRIGAPIAEFKEYEVLTRAETPAGATAR